MKLTLGDSQQQRGRGARLADTVNVSELLINLVNNAVPKLLRGTDQNGVWSDNPLEGRVASSSDHRGIGGTYVSLVTCRERGKPVWLPVTSGWQANRKGRC